MNTPSQRSFKPELPALHEKDNRMSRILGISLALTIALVAFSTLSIPASVAPANSSNVVYGTDGSMVGQDPDLFRQTEPVLRFHNQSRD